MTSATANNIERALEIKKQIGIMSLMACGARDFVAEDSITRVMLMFRVTINPRDFNKIRITLNALDLYDVELVKINRKTWASEVVKSETDVYAEDLGRFVYDMCNK